MMDIIDISLGLFGFAIFNHYASRNCVFKQVESRQDNGTLLVGISCMPQWTPH